VLCPIEDAALKARLLSEVLGKALHDNVKARRLATDGSYARVDGAGARLRSQAVLLEMAKVPAEPVPASPALGLVPNRAPR
jgi:hypothetical protein